MTNLHSSKNYILPMRYRQRKKYLGLLKVVCLIFFWNKQLCSSLQTYNCIFDQNSLYKPFCWVIIWKVVKYFLSNFRQWRESQLFFISPAPLFILATTSFQWDKGNGSNVCANLRLYASFSFETNSFALLYQHIIVYLTKICFTSLFIGLSHGKL